MAEQVKVKEWYKSVSLWLSIVAAVVVAVIQALVDNQIVAETSSWVIVALAVVNVAKRGLVESTAVKSGAVSSAIASEVAKSNPPQG